MADPSQPLPNTCAPHGRVSCRNSIVTKESNDRFASVAYVFARHLHLNLGVPVGIINNARGGSLGISWTSREELLAIKAPAVAEEVAVYEAEAKEWETPEYAERLAKARREVDEVWRPKTRRAIKAFWDKHDAFMKANLSAEKYAEWRKIADAWHVSQEREAQRRP